MVPEELAQVLHAIREEQAHTREAVQRLADQVAALVAARPCVTGSALLRELGHACLRAVASEAPPAAEGAHA